MSPILLQFLTLSMSFSMIFAGTIMPALGEKLGRAELCILNETIVRNSSQQPAASKQHLSTRPHPVTLSPSRTTGRHSLRDHGNRLERTNAMASYIMFPLYFVRQIVDVSSHLLWFALFADCVPPEQRAMGGLPAVCGRGHVDHNRDRRQVDR